MDALRKLTQLGDRARQLGPRFLKQPRCLGRGFVDSVLGQLQAHGQRRQALLGAVVEVALQPAPLVVGKLHQASARFDEAPRVLLTLGHNGRQAEGRKGRHRDEQLRAQHAACDRFEREGADVVDRVPHGQAGGCRDRQRRASLTKAQSRPGEAGKAR